MKRNFLKLMSVFAFAAISMVACEKPNSGNGGIKEDDDPVNENLHASLKGSAYVPVVIDEESAKAIEKKIVADLRVDDVNNFLYVWSDTYVAGEGAGLNFYEGAGYTSLVVGNVGWSGAGFIHEAAAGELEPFVNNDLDKWYFHLAYKTNDATVAHRVQILWGPKDATTDYAFAIAADFNDNGTITKVVNPISNNGKVVANEWNEYEIPLKDMGIDFTQKLFATNYITVLSGGAAGTQLNLDAIFFYKK